MRDQPEHNVHEGGIPGLTEELPPRNTQTVPQRTNDETTVPDCMKREPDGSYRKTADELCGDIVDSSPNRVYTSRDPPNCWSRSKHRKHDLREPDSR